MRNPGIRKLYDYRGGFFKLSVLYVLFPFVFLQPLLLADAILFGRVERQVVWGSGSSAVEAYVASSLSAVETAVKFFIYFMLSFALLRLTEAYDPDPKNWKRGAEYFIAALMAAGFLWFLAWSITAYYRAALFPPKYEWVGRLINLLAACNLCYPATLFAALQSPLSLEAAVKIAAAFLTPIPAWKASGWIYKAVEERLKKRVKKYILKDPADSARRFANLYSSMVKEAPSFREKGIARTLPWKAAVAALRDVITSNPSMAPAVSMLLAERKVYEALNKDLNEIYKTIARFSPPVLITTRREEEGKRKWADRDRFIREEPREKPRVREEPKPSWETRKPTGEASKPAGEACKPSVEEPIAKPSKPAEKPIIPPEVERNLMETAREREKLMERQALYESIVSLKIFDKVVGLKEAKEEIVWRFLIPVLFPEKAPKGVEPKYGILLFGPPGTGKTELMRALMGACSRLGLNVLEITPSTLDDMWVGEGERKVKAVFEEAKKAPSIIFIDEADAAMHRTQFYDSRYHAGPTKELLKQMDGLGSENLRVLIIATTNKPWDIDEAFLRPGRIERKIYVPPPNAEERAEIFRLHMPPGDVEGQVDYSRLAELTKPTPQGYYSGADIREICRRAKVNASKAGRAKPTMMDLEAAVREVQPSIPASLVKMYEKYAGIRHPEALKDTRGTFYTA